MDSEPLSFFQRQIDNKEVKSRKNENILHHWYIWILR